MVIRTAIVSDATSLSTLVSSLSHFFMSSPDEPIPEWLAATLTVPAFKERLLDTGFAHLIAEQDNKIVGYLSVTKAGHLYHCFVAEDYQGQGISRALWDSIQTQNYSKTWTVRSSLNAVPVYETFGFRSEGEPQEKNGLAFQPMSLNKN